MHKRDRISSGFTIVELLIVVVVIAILAAITVVAYTNFQSRAYDSAVQNDISNFTKALQLFNAENGRYPVSTSELNSVISTVSSSVYESHSNAIHYCYNRTSNTFAIGGVSKSGTGFINKVGVASSIAGWPETSAASICSSATWFDFPLPTGTLTTYRHPTSQSWGATYTIP